jgi:hypothetical protein
MIPFIAKTRFATRKVQMRKRPSRKVQRLFAILVESKPRCRKIRLCSKRLVGSFDGRAVSKKPFVFIVHSSKMMGQVWRNRIGNSSCLQKRGITPGSKLLGCMPSKPNTPLSVRLVKDPFIRCYLYV